MFYLYKGKSFSDANGYQLLMMAKYFKKEREIRICSVTDIAKLSRISSKHRIPKANNMRVEKLNLTDFEWEQNCIAKVYIEEDGGAIAGVSN